MLLSNLCLKFECRNADEICFSELSSERLESVVLASEDSSTLNFTSNIALELTELPFIMKISSLVVTLIGEIPLDIYAAYSKKSPDICVLPRTVKDIALSCSPFPSQIMFGELCSIELSATINMHQVDQNAPALILLSNLPQDMLESNTHKKSFSGKNIYEIFPENESKIAIQLQMKVYMTDPTLTDIRLLFCYVPRVSSF